MRENAIWFALAFAIAATACGGVETREDEQLESGLQASSLDDSHDQPVVVGRFGKMSYVQHFLRFNGTVDGAQYHVNAWIIAPANPDQANGRVVVDVFNTCCLDILGEVPVARVHLRDQMLFSRGFVYAAVRWDTEAFSHPHRLYPNLPLDELVPASTPRTIGFSILAQFADALRRDPVAKRIAGKVKAVYSYSFSQSAGVQRSFLIAPPAGARLPIFDGSLVSAIGEVRYTMATAPTDPYIHDSSPMPASAGKVIAFNPETEVTLNGSANVRRTQANYRNYEAAGAAHIYRAFIAGFDNDDPNLGIPDTSTANPLDFTVVERALFIALDKWVTQATRPPAAAWLAPAGDVNIPTDANGNATGGIRLPDVHVGRGTYIAFDSTYRDRFIKSGATGDILRAISGNFIDLAANFPSHEAYVDAVAAQARALTRANYLLQEDADAIVAAARASKVGN